MDKIKFKHINKQLISCVVAGAITITLVGCNNEKQYSNGTVLESIISTENNEKKLNLKKVLVLTSDEETLFVSYDNKNDLYVTDIFTNTKYKIYNGSFHNFFSDVTFVKKIIDDNVFIYNKEYACQKLDDYLNDNIKSLNKNNAYDKLSQIFINSNNINSKLFQTDKSELISLENVIALANGDETIFAKYDNSWDQYITDIFTYEKYDVSTGYENVIERLSSGFYIINDDYYKVNNITTYPYIVENIVNGHISRNVLYKSLMETNMNNKVLQKTKENN